MKANTLTQRIGRSGWTIERALTAPLRKMNMKGHPMLNLAVLSTGEDV